MEITVNVHESVLSQKLVFWTSNWKHVIKYVLKCLVTLLTCRRYTNNCIYLSNYLPLSQTSNLIECMLITAFVKITETKQTSKLQKLNRMRLTLKFWCRHCHVVGPTPWRRMLTQYISDLSPQHTVRQLRCLDAHPVSKSPHCWTDPRPYMYDLKNTHTTMF